MRLAQAPRAGRLSHDFKSNSPHAKANLKISVNRIVELQWKLDRRSSSGEDEAQAERLTRQFQRKQDKYNEDFQLAQARFRGRHRPQDAGRD
jgi:hypothetical protein